MIRNISPVSFELPLPDILILFFFVISINLVFECSASTKVIPKYIQQNYSAHLSPRIIFLYNFMLMK